MNLWLQTSFGLLLLVAAYVETQLLYRQLVSCLPLGSPLYNLVHSRIHLLHPTQWMLGHFLGRADCPAAHGVLVAEDSLQQIVAYFVFDVKQSIVVGVVRVQGVFVFVVLVAVDLVEHERTRLSHGLSVGRAKGPTVVIGLYTVVIVKNLTFIFTFPSVHLLINLIHILQSIYIFVYCSLCIYLIANMLALPNFKKRNSRASQQPTHSRPIRLDDSMEGPFEDGDSIAEPTFETQNYVYQLKTRCNQIEYQKVKDAIYYEQTLKQVMNQNAQLQEQFDNLHNEYNMALEEKENYRELLTDVRQQNYGLSRQIDELRHELRLIQQQSMQQKALEQQIDKEQGHTGRLVRKKEEQNEQMRQQLTYCKHNLKELKQQLERAARRQQNRQQKHRNSQQMHQNSQQMHQSRQFVNRNREEVGRGRQQMALLLKNKQILINQMKDRQRQLQQQIEDHQARQANLQKQITQQHQHQIQLMHQQLQMSQEQNAQNQKQLNEMSLQLGKSRSQVKGLEQYKKYLEECLKENQAKNKQMQQQIYNYQEQLSKARAELFQDKIAARQAINQLKNQLEEQQVTLVQQQLQTSRHMDRLKLESTPGSPTHQCKAYPTKQGQMLQTYKDMENTNKQLRQALRELEDKHKQLEDKHKQLEDKHKQLDDKHKQLEDKHKQLEDKYQKKSLKLQSVEKEVGKQYQERISSLQAEIYRLVQQQQQLQIEELGQDVIDIEEIGQLGYKQKGQYEYQQKQNHGGKSIGYDGGNSMDKKKQGYKMEMLALQGQKQELEQKLTQQTITIQQHLTQIKIMQRQNRQLQRTNHQLRQKTNQYTFLGVNVEQKVRTLQHLQNELARANTEIVSSRNKACARQARLKQQIEQKTAVLLKMQQELTQLKRNNLNNQQQKQDLIDINQQYRLQVHQHQLTMQKQHQLTMQKQHQLTMQKQHQLTMQKQHQLTMQKQHQTQVSQYKMQIQLLKQQNLKYHSCLKELISAKQIILNLQENLRKCQQGREKQRASLDQYKSGMVAWGEKEKGRVDRQERLDRQEQQMVQGWKEGSLKYQQLQMKHQYLQTKCKDVQQRCRHLQIKNRMLQEQAININSDRAQRQQTHKDLYQRQQTQNDLYQMQYNKQEQTAKFSHSIVGSYNHHGITSNHNNHIIVGNHNIRNNYQESGAMSPLELSRSRAYPSHHQHRKRLQMSLWLTNRKPSRHYQ